MKQNESQLAELKKLVESGILSEDQRRVIGRLIFATEQGTERQLADYVSSMDTAAVHWAFNHWSFIKSLV